MCGQKRKFGRAARERESDPEYEGTYNNKTHLFHAIVKPPMNVSALKINQTLLGSPQCDFPFVSSTKSNYY
jgi:hypothetical protein